MLNVEYKGKKGDRDNIKDVDGGRAFAKRQEDLALILGPASNLPYDPTALYVSNDKFFKWIQPHQTHP